MPNVPDTKAPTIKNAILCQIQATNFSCVNFCNSLPIGLILSSIISLQPILQDASRVIILWCNLVIALLENLSMALFSI